MAEHLASLRKKGITAKETTLWTNANPGSAFNAQILTMSQSMTNFDFIRIHYRVSSGVNRVVYIDFPISFVQISGSGVSYPQMGLLAIESTGTYAYCRTIQYQSTTTLYFLLAYTMNGTQNSPYMCIPTQISGIKYS